MTTDRYTDQARLLIDTVKLLRAHFMSGQPDSTVFTEAQLTTLIALRDQGETSLKCLAGALGVSSPSASAMVDRLVEAGMAEREPAKHDRREICVKLTESGRTVVANYEEAFLKSAVELLERVGPECAEQWCSVYQTVRNVLLAEYGGKSQPAMMEGK